MLELYSNFVIWVGITVLRLLARSKETEKLEQINYMEKDKQERGNMKVEASGSSTVDTPYVQMCSFSTENLWILFCFLLNMTWYSLFLLSSKHMKIWLLQRAIAYA